MQRLYTGIAVTVTNGALILGSKPRMLANSREQAGRIAEMSARLAAMDYRNFL